MTVFSSLSDKTIHSHTFDGDRAFTAVKIQDDAGNDITLAINPNTATIALALADAIRAAALTYLPAPEARDPMDKEQGEIGLTRNEEALP